MFVTKNTIMTNIMTKTHFFRGNADYTWAKVISSGLKVFEGRLSPNLQKLCSLKYFGERTFKTMFFQGFWRKNLQKHCFSKGGKCKGNNCNLKDHL